MAVTASTRLQITRWSAESDPFNRTQQDADHAILDNLVAIDVQDLLSNRPAPGVRGRFFTESSASAGLPGTTWREDGASWRSVGSRVVAASATDIGQIVKGAPAQSANLEEWRNSAAVAQAWIGSDGTFRTLNDIHANGALFVGNAAYYNGTLNVLSRSTGEISQVIRAIAAQSADLLRGQDSGGNDVMKVGVDGSLGPIRSFAGTDVKRLNVGSFGLLQDRNVGGDTTSADSYKTVIAHNAYISAQSTNTWSEVNDYANKWRMEMGGRGVKLGYRPSANGTPETWNDAGWTDIFTLSMDNPTMLLRASGSGNVVQAVQAASGQTANIAEWDNNAGTPLTKIDSAGVITAPAINAGAFQAFTTAQAASFSTDVFIAASNVNSRPFVVRGIASQAGHLTEWQNSATTPISYVASDGGNYAAYVLINNTTRKQGALLTVSPSNGTTPGIAIDTVSGQTAQPFGVTAPGTNNVIAGVTPSGNVQGTGAYTTLSDAAVKTNVRELVHDPLDVIRQLRPVHYDYIGGERDQVGFIANEVEPVLPHAVTPWDRLYGGIPDVDGRLGLRTDAILAYLTAAVQRIDSRLSVLERAA